MLFLSILHLQQTSDAILLFIYIPSPDSVSTWTDSKKKIITRFFKHGTYIAYSCMYSYKKKVGMQNNLEIFIKKWQISFIGNVQYNAKSWGIEAHTYTRNLLFSYGFSKNGFASHFFFVNTAHIYMNEWTIDVTCFIKYFEYIYTIFHVFTEGVVSTGDGP